VLPISLLCTFSFAFTSWAVGLFGEPVSLNIFFGVSIILLGFVFIVEAFYGGDSV